MVAEPVLRSRRSSENLQLLHNDGTLDAAQLKDLRGLGKPLSFDGNDTDYQELRFSFQSHMSFVSTVSHMLMDKCEAERNPITLAGVKAIEETHLKCCIQM